MLATALLLLADTGPGRGDTGDGGVGFLTIAGVVVVAALVIGTVLFLVTRASRRGEPGPQDGAERTHPPGEVGRLQ